jgi:hypothetical protein
MRRAVLLVLGVIFLAACAVLRRREILDSHASLHPAMKRYGLIARTITCPDGTLRVGLTPVVGPQGPTGKGSWTIVSGIGAFKGLRGSGKEKILYDLHDRSIGRETLTATVTR